MRFWRINSPEYETDYEQSYINGALDHPFGLPGVDCDVCGEMWAGSRILPYDCPEPFRQHKNTTDGCPISRPEHAALQEELISALPLDGEPFVALKPGDDFQPCFLDVPSRPRADFLWPWIGDLVVSARIKDALMECAPADIAACPVTLRKIGKREAKLPAPIPSTGEPEDIIDEVPICEETADMGPYFEILIQKESGYPPGGTPTGICSGCGRRTIDNTTREIRMTPEMWNGDKIFFLATTLYIVVTEDVKERIAALRPTNVVFEKM